MNLLQRGGSDKKMKGKEESSDLLLLLLEEDFFFFLLLVCPYQHVPAGAEARRAPRTLRDLFARRLIIDHNFSQLFRWFMVIYLC